MDGECNCPIVPSAVYGKDVKTHVKDCPIIEEFYKSIKSDLDSQKEHFPSTGGGFIATPSMSDINRLNQRITELEDRILRLENGS